MVEVTVKLEMLENLASILIVKSIIGPLWHRVLMSVWCVLRHHCWEITVVRQARCLFFCIPG